MHEADNRREEDNVRSFHPSLLTYATSYTCDADAVKVASASVTDGITPAGG